MVLRRSNGIDELPSVRHTVGLLIELNVMKERTQKNTRTKAESDSFLS